MSCYIVSDSVMHRCAAAMMLLAEPGAVFVDEFTPPAPPGAPFGTETGTSWGNRLFTMNAAAFTARYEGRHAEDGAVPDDYAFEPWPVRAPADNPQEFEHASVDFQFPVAEMYRSLENLRYQCSEGSIPETPLFKAVTAVFHRLAHFIAAAAPAVRALPWGDMPDVPQMGGPAPKAPTGAPDTFLALLKRPSAIC